MNLSSSVPSVQIVGIMYIPVIFLWTNTELNRSFLSLADDDVLIRAVDTVLVPVVRSCIEHRSSRQLKGLGIFYRFDQYVHSIGNGRLL